MKRLVMNQELLAAKLMVATLERNRNHERAVPYVQPELLDVTARDRAAAEVGYRMAIHDMSEILFGSLS